MAGGSFSGSSSLTPVKYGHQIIKNICLYKDSHRDPNKIAPIIIRLAIIDKETRIIVSISILQILLQGTYEGGTTG